MMNKLELHIFRTNVILFESMKLNIFWDHSSSTRDLFIQNNEVSICGESAHLELLDQFLRNINHIVSLLRGQLGIIEAKMAIPAIYLKKVIG